MSNSAPDAPAHESFGGDLAGMFSFYIDPAGAARCLPHKWFWVAPLLLVSAVSIGAGMLQMPVVEHAMEVMQLPGNATPDQLATVVKFQRAAVLFAPVGTLLVYAFNALILYATASVLGMKGTYRTYLNLIAGLSLIPLLALIATTIIVKSKEITSIAELHPPLGLDILMPSGANKMLTAFVGYLSVFELWWIAMAILILSTAFGVTKGKAFLLVLPLCLLGVVFRVIVAALQPG